MATSVLKSVIHEGITWHTFEDEPVKALPGMIGQDQAIDLPGIEATIVKRSKDRKVYLVQLGDVGTFFLKHDICRNPRTGIKRLLKSKVRAEFQSYLDLRDNSIPSVRYVAWGKRGLDGFILTEALPGASECLESWEKWCHNATSCEQWLTALSDLLLQTIRMQVHHPDLHPGNILVQEDRGKPRMYYVDVYRVRKRRNLSTTQVSQMLAMLHPFLRACSPRLRSRILRPFASLRNWSTDECFRRICQTTSKRSDKYRRTRRKKFLKSSSAVDQITTKLGTWRITAELTLENAESLIADHQKSGTVLEPMEGDWECELTQVRLGDDTYLIREFQNSEKADDQDAWLSCWGLSQYGLPVCKNLAWLQTPSGPSFVITKAPTGAAINQVLTISQPRERIILLRKLGQLLADLCNLSIYHPGLRTSNIAVGPNQLFIMSSKDVKFRYKDKTRAILAHFRNTLSDLPECVTRWEVLNALARFRQDTGRPGHTVLEAGKKSGAFVRNNVH